MKVLLAALSALSLALALPAASGAPTARSYEFLGAKWPDSAMPVPYCINTGGIPMMGPNQPLMTAQAFISLVQQQFAKWQALPDSYITFRYTGVCANDPRNGSDGVNTVGWAPLAGSAAGQVFPGASQETPYRRGLGGDFVEVDIIIDDRLPRSFDQAAYLNHLLPVIILHEIGHFIGLAHSPRGCAVMAPSSLQLEFCEDDIAGARALYPGPERAAGLSIAETSCGPAGVDVVFRWSPSPEAEGYFFDLTIDPFFSAWFGAYAGPGPSAALWLTNILPGRPHFWRLWSFGSGMGGHSYGPAFVTPNCRGGAPVPAGPAGLSAATFCTTERAVAASFGWIRSLAADGYFIDLSLDPGFGGFINAFVFETSLTWTGLLPGARHYYRVFAFNAFGGAHSYVDSFTTPVC